MGGVMEMSDKMVLTGQVEKESEVKFLRKSPTSKFLICEQ
jgi:hypothetical protein